MKRNQQPAQGAKPSAVKVVERAEDLIRLYDLQAAAGDASAVEATMKELSDLIVTMLRWRIGYNLKDKGHACVKRAYDEIMNCIVAPATEEAAYSVRFYLGSVAVKRAKDALRAAGVLDRHEAEDGERGIVSRTTASDGPAAVDLRLDVRRALENMPPHFREFVWMLTVGTDYKTMAEAFDVDQRTLRNWRTRIATRYGLADLLRR